ncbi:MAG: hypothetical protein WAQ25_03190, partial [Candidatus Saccharimonas sp.]
FGAIFNQLPTYDDLDSGTQKTPLFTGVNSVFRLASLEKSLMVTLVQSIYKELVDEIIRWNDILSGVKHREAAAF